MLWKFLLHTIFSFLLIFPRNVAAVATNRTIDDEYGDSVTGLKPIFLPTTIGAWEGETCGECLIQPDKARAFRQTFNAATFRPEIGPISIGLSFKGTAIYVFFIIVNFIPGDVTTLTECNFTLDGQHVGYYRHDPTSAGPQYNVLVFSMVGLANNIHKLNVSTGGVDYHVFVNFDYAIYTSDDTDTPDIISTKSAHNTTPTTSAIQSSSTVNNHDTFTLNTQQPINHDSSTAATQTGTTSSGAPQLDGSNRPSVGIIVGGAVGGLVVLGLLLLLILYWRKRHRRDKNYPPSKLFGYNPHDSKLTPRYIRGDAASDNMGISEPSIIASDFLTTSSISVEVRNARRAELERQLQVVEQELSILETESRVSSRQLSFRRKFIDSKLNAEMGELRRQIARIRERIEFLQTQDFPESAPSSSDECSRTSCYSTQAPAQVYPSHIDSSLL